MSSYYMTISALLNYLREQHNLPQVDHKYKRMH